MLPVKSSENWRPAARARGLTSFQEAVNRWVILRAYRAKYGRGGKLYACGHVARAVDRLVRTGALERAGTIFTLTRVGETAGRLLDESYRRNGGWFIARKTVSLLLPEHMRELLQDTRPEEPPPLTVRTVARKSRRARASRKNS